MKNWLLIISDDGRPDYITNNSIAITIISILFLILIIIGIALIGKLVFTLINKKK